MLAKPGGARLRKHPGAGRVAGAGAGFAGVAGDQNAGVGPEGDAAAVDIVERREQFRERFDRNTGADGAEKDAFAAFEAPRQGEQPARRQSGLDGPVENQTPVSRGRTFQERPVRKIDRARRNVERAAAHHDLSTWVGDQDSCGDGIIGDRLSQVFGEALFFLRPAFLAAGVQPSYGLQERVDAVERFPEIVGDESRGVQSGPAFGSVGRRPLLPDDVGRQKGEHNGDRKRRAVIRPPRRTLGSTSIRSQLLHFQSFLQNIGIDPRAHKTSC